jgi:xanthine dehydrogenase YagR molybdenum-binding subunit
MVAKWPEKPRLLGKDHTRIDGFDKATGRAKYSFDINLPGLLQASILRCPHAHAKVTKLDTSKAEKAPGVKAVYPMVKEGQELFHVGEEVVALAADTEEHLLDALRLVDVKYEELPFQVRERDVLEKDLATMPEGGPKKERNNILPPQQRTQGDVAKAFKDAEVVMEGQYGMAHISHQCLESHGLVAAWNKELTELTVYASIQATINMVTDLTRHFKLPAGSVKCITHHMGGGYGSKFNADPQGIAACELAKSAKAPVKLMLDRADEVVIGGSRPSAYGTVKLGAMKNGTIIACEIDCYGTGGIANSPTVGPLPYVYLFPNLKTKHTVVRTNIAKQRAMRAPGHPQSCYLTDCALDDLAAKLEMNPLVVRIKNLPPTDAESALNAPESINAIRHGLYLRQIKVAAKLSDWKNKWHPPGDEKGVVKTGLGMALHTWGGAASSGLNECTVLIDRTGNVTAQSSTQDLGTAQRTVTAIVTAEILGLNPNDIIVKIGESQYGASSGSGGSTTCPSQAPAALQAASKARDELFAKIAPRLGSKADDLVIRAGRVFDKVRNKSWAFREACARLGMDQIKATGSWNAAATLIAENGGVSNNGVCGVQVAEVTVDTETGVVKVKKVIAVQDCGLIINKLACESQVAGGVIMGLNYALFEENILDRNTGRQVNADMEFYKLGGIKDMPKIVVHMMDMPERGVVGIGEPPTISTHAAIGNAIFNAIGARVSDTPFTPDRVLAALAKKGGKQS